MNDILPPTIPETEGEIQIRATAQELVAKSRTAVILTYQDLSEATDLVKALKLRWKEAEDIRTSITGPINKGLDEINARFKTIKTPLEEAESMLKQKMLGFTQREEERARKEAAEKEAIRLEQEKKDRAAFEARQKEEAEQAADPMLDRAPVPESAPAVFVPSAPIQPIVRKTTYGQSGAAFTSKKAWDFSVVDLSKVPLEYMVLNETKVRAVVKAGIREIPGLTIFEKAVASVR
jgi:hypothetical protein